MIMSCCGLPRRKYLTCFPKRAGVELRRVGVAVNSIESVADT